MTEVIFGNVLSALSMGAGALIILFIHRSITHQNAHRRPSCRIISNQSANK